VTAFRRELDARAVDPDGRRWIFVPYDQLTDAVGPLANEDPEELGIVVVETTWKARRRPYHAQKLAWVLANLRHFVLEQAERGVAVQHVAGEESFARILEPVARERGPLRVMRPAERELRADLEPLVRKGLLEIVPHEGWITTSEQFQEAFRGGKRWRMDTFYRHVRKQTGILMCDGRPVGGKLSFDAENRRRWRGDPPAPEPLTFPGDPIKQEVFELIERDFAAHPGRLCPERLPATSADAERAWRWARRHCLEHFGPYEDAMSRASRTLFHTQISGLLNDLRLLPARVVADVARMDLPIASQEGFIRQVLGWREFVHHVHDATDGFRRLPTGEVPAVADAPGDGGYAIWSGRPGSPASRASASPAAAPKTGATKSAELDGGACPSHLDASEPLPPAFWGSPSGLACLDRVVSEVWETGYGHHITRLMVLSNLATLLGTSPRELCDWFWVAYTDAYDWVVEPNVLGMGTFGLGELFTTKPYVSGSAYIDRMSDHCGACSFSPKRDCPITSLYWTFLERNEGRLRGNPRVAMPLRSLEKRTPVRRERDRWVSQRTRTLLAAGEVVRPDDLIPDPKGKGPTGRRNGGSSR
jgi:deoxyribodipyrimidine photolyase-related protein